MYSFWRPRSHHLIPLHPDNVNNNHWIVLLEANTIIGAAAERLRAVSATQRRMVVWRLQGLKLRPFLVLEGFDPRVHFAVLCPQLYKYDHDGVLAPVRGEEIGAFIARALNHNTVLRCPWYKLMDKIPDQPPITETILTEFDTLVIEPEAAVPTLVPASPHPMAMRELEHTSAP